jgi:putative transposase
LPAELVTFIEGLYLRKAPPSIATIHRMACGLAVTRGWPEPGYRTVLDIAKALEPCLVALAQEGDKAYREAFDLIYRREAGRPNEMWQADHTELDMLVVDPPGPPARPWLTVILDDHSRAVPGYAVNLAAPSALQTALALRQAIWRKADPAWHVCGIPQTLYSDYADAEVGIVAVMPMSL